MTSRASASSHRSVMASGENPPKITEWATPMRAQASMATGSSGIIGMYMAARSPLRRPSPNSALANRCTSASSSR